MELNKTTHHRPAIINPAWKYGRGEANKYGSVTGYRTHKVDGPREPDARLHGKPQIGLTR